MTPVWREQKGWRYRFQAQGVKYNKSWFPTKAAAKAAEAAHKAELKKTAQAKTRTGITFLELSNEYLDYASRRFVVKTYKAKAAVFRAFVSFAGDVPIQQVGLSL